MASASSASGSVLVLLAKIRSAVPCVVTLTITMTNVPISTISTTLPCSVDMFLCLYSPCVYLSE